MAVVVATGALAALMTMLVFTKYPTDALRPMLNL